MTEKREKTNKGQKTRELIFDSAISLFKSKGFEQTTMRDIASDCGLAVGNAYYYFGSKEAIVFELYKKTLQEQVAGCREILATKLSLKDGLIAVIQNNLNTLQPYQAILRVLFKFAVDPDSELNPFAPPTVAIRERAQGIFADLVANSREKYSDDLRKDLPFLLWLFYMGLVLYWLQDCSPEHQKTTKLLRLSAGLVAQLAGIAGIAIMRPLYSNIRQILAEFAPSDRTSTL